jgi:putative membrane protein
VAAFKTESTSGNDPDVKAWAAKTLPTIEDHLKMAQDIAKNVGVVGTSGTKRSKRHTSK